MTDHARQDVGVASARPTRGRVFLTHEFLITVDTLKPSDSPSTSPPQSGLAARLGRGCFVKVTLTDGDFWAEITSIHGTRANATLRHVVDQDGTYSKNADQWLGKTITVTESDIADTGCDTLCWC